MNEKIKELKNNFNNKIKINERIEFNNVYIVTMEWDYNDADYISCKNEFEQNEFESNFTLKLILSFVSQDRGKLFKGNSIYGKYIDWNKDISLLSRYLDEFELVAYGEQDMCHSVEDVSILYYDEHGIAHAVSLPNFDEFFESKEEAIEILNFLLEKYFEDEDE